MAAIRFGAKQVAMRSGLQTSFAPEPASRADPHVRHGHV
jgi:hypothetical protein